MAHVFLTKFSQIGGESIGERRRNLNKFLKDISFSLDEKEFILDNISRKTYLENLLYVDILIYYKETSRLVEIFKEGNEVFVSKIMKHPWFFQEAFSNITPKTLVDDFLPLLSFSIKIKLLRSLSYVYSEEKIGQVFDHVMSRYGLVLAETLITSCNSEKITDILKDYKIKFSIHQLKMIYKKEPKLIKIYLEEQYQYYNNDIFDNNFLIYLAQQNPIYFWELIEKYQISGGLKLGRRTTKKLIPTRTKEIVNDPDKYIKYLRYETLVRKLNKQGHFKHLYYNLFPRKIEAIQYRRSLCDTLLKYYPKSDQYNLFSKTFNDVIKKDIWNYTSCIADNILDLINDSKVREAWAQLKYKESGDEKYLKYYEINKSIPIIKEKINTTSCIKNRRKLIYLLVNCCAVNKDLKSLEEVLKYFCIRHKNDDRSTRVQVLQTIEYNFNLDELTSSQWKYIIEILNIHTLNKEYEQYMSNFRLKHIEYLFNNNGSEEDKSFFILEYIKEQEEYCSLYLDFDIIKKSAEVQRAILLQLTEYLDTIVKSDSDSCYKITQCIGKIFWFNSKYPGKSINIQDNKTLVECLSSITKEGQYMTHNFEKYFPTLICKLNRNEFENELLNYFWVNKSLRQISFDLVLQWFLTYDPMVVVNNFDLIIEASLSQKYHFWHIIKQYSHVSLDDKVVKYCLDQLKKDDTDQKSKFIQPLSIIGTPELYIKTIEDLNLIPTSSKIAVDDTESREMFKIQKVFLKKFQNVWNPLEYLPLLIDKFCQGDYLRESLTPLYVAFHKIPENKLEVYLNKITDNKAMSVKKHGLFLARYVFPRKKVLEIFSSFQEDKNASLQKCLCLSSLRYFTKVQTRECFEKVLSYMTFLKEHDIESMEVLSSVQIPKNYKPRYIINFLNLLEKLKTSPNAIGFNKLMSTVLDNIDKECLSNLPQDFCKAIINNYFGTNYKKGEEIDNIFEFVIKFLIHHKNQTDNFNYVFSLLSNCKAKFFYLKSKEQSMIYNFFNVFFTTASKEEVDLEFVIKFSTEWEKVFTELDTFKEHVLLNLLRFKKEANGKIELYSKSIADFAEHIEAKYGGFIFLKFCTITAEFCIFGSDEEVIHLLTEILKYKTSTLNCILVMELITTKGDLFDNIGGIRTMYREIDSILKQATDPKVQLSYNLLTKN